MNKSVVIATFYQFADFPDFKEKQKPWLDFCNQRKLKGTILIAHEGINSTISGGRKEIDELMSFLRSDARFKNLEWKESYADFQPFLKMKVRLKEEIVRLGLKDLNVAKNVGEYLEAGEWDAFISDKNNLVIDTRNDYEVRIGTFENALDPKTKTFRQFPDWAEKNLKNIDKNKKIGMFCTGGIRCEKSTAYLKEQGFKNVYHLKGGILKYLEETKNKQGKWQGTCFVFDDRVAVGDKLEMKGNLFCSSCNTPMNTDDLRFSPEEALICLKCNDNSDKIY